MDEDRSEECEPPVAPDDEFFVEFLGNTFAEAPDHAAWNDERFLTWLAEREGSPSASALSRAGRRLIARAYCRTFGIRLLQAPPPIVTTQRGAFMGRLAPLTEVRELATLAISNIECAVVLPPECDNFPCVACRVSRRLDSFAPFIDVGDTMLIALSPPEWSPAATIRHVAGRTFVANDAAAGDFIGTLVALWSTVIT